MAAYLALIMHMSSVAERDQSFYDRRMLQILHRLSLSLFARILFSIVLFSFVIFGIGDVLRQRGGDSTVAEIGGENLSSGQLMQAFNNVTRGKVDPATARKMGLLENVLNSMIDDTLFRHAALDDGINVGKPQILDMIAKIPQLRDEKTGGIDRAKFQALLQSQRWSEADLVDYLQHQTMLRVIEEADLSVPPPPKTLVNALYGFALEQRRGDIIRIQNSAMVIPSPTEDKLMAYYHQHESSYMAPEYRSFSYITLSPDDLAKTITVSADEVKKEYDAHTDKFTLPERRDIVQVMAPDEAKAKDVSALVKSGKSLADAARAAGLNAPQDMGLLAKSDLPQQLQAPVYTDQAGQTLDPVETPFGWDVVTVKSIEPSHVMPFDQARATIEDDLKMAAARDKLAEEAKKIDDQLSGGATLAEAGKPFGLTTVDIKNTDDKGHSSVSDTVLKGHDDILAAAFQATKDSSPQIQDGADGSIFALQVTNITPPVLKPFEAVKADVVKAYTTAAKADAAKARAEDALKRYQSGVAFATLAKDANVIPVSIGPATRVSPDKSMDHDVLKTLFSLEKQNDAGIASTADGPVLVRVTDIVPVASVNNKDESILASSLADQMQKDIASEYEAALRKAYNVKIHQGVLDDLKKTDQ